MRDRNQVEMPINLGIKIEKKVPVRQLVEICDELDYLSKRKEAKPYVR